MSKALDLKVKRSSRASELKAYDNEMQRPSYIPSSQADVDMQVPHGSKL